MQTTNTKELKKSVRDVQDSIKLKLYEHGKQAQITRKTGISAFRIRRALNIENPDLQLLEKIEKALK